MESPSPTTPSPRRSRRPPFMSMLSTSSLRRIDSDVRSPEEERTALLDREGGISTPTTPGTPATSGYGATSRPGSILASLKRSSKRKTTFKKRLNYYVPSTKWIPEYKLAYLGGDFLAGLTISCMLIPQSVSYATSLAHMSPVTGLFSAAFPSLIYALLGTSRQLNVAPEAALSLMLGQAVAEITHDYPDPHGRGAETLAIDVATGITLQVGLISFLLGFFRLGFIDVVLSRALLRGFISAIAVVILIEQLIIMFGLSDLMHTAHPGTTFEKIVFLIENAWTHSHVPTTIISFSALLALIVVRAVKGRFPKQWYIYRFPEVLVVVILSTYLSAHFNWESDGVNVLGHVKVSTGKEFFSWPLHQHNYHFLTRTTSTAVLISIVGFLDSIVAAKGAGVKYGYSISPNRELVALGASNLFASFVPGTLPAYGSITRTRINGEVGARTQMSMLVCSTVILLVTFFLLPYLETLPTCVLASIIGLVVISLLQETPHDLAFYGRMRAYKDLALMSLTFILSIVWNVEIGIVCSLIISLLMVVHRSSKTRMHILGRIPGTDRWKPINENPDAQESMTGVLIIRIRDNLDFANTAQLKERLRRLELYGMQPHHPSEDPRRTAASDLVFHLSDCERCDATAIQIFYELFKEYLSRGVSIYITHVRPDVMQMFRRAKIVDLLGAEYFLDTVAEAISLIEESR